MYVYKVCSFNKDHSGSNLCNNHILPILTKTFCRATKSRADVREREYLDRRTFIPRYQIYEVFKLLCDSPKGQGGITTNWCQPLGGIFATEYLSEKPISPK